MTELDHGTRCDDHIGEVFPPRCTACALAAQENSDPTPPPPTDQEKPANG